MSKHLIPTSPKCPNVFSVFRSVVWEASFVENVAVDNDAVTWVWQKLVVVVVCWICHLIFQRCGPHSKSGTHGVVTLPVHGICQRMGACLCKDSSSQSDIPPPSNHVTESAGQRSQGVSPAQSQPTAVAEVLCQGDQPNSPERQNLVDLYTSKINSLVLETLTLIRTLVDK